MKRLLLWIITGLFLCGQAFAGPPITQGINKSDLGAISASSITDTGLTASKPVFTDASKVLTSTGTLAVDQGGTGATSLTDGGILLGSGTGAVTALGVAANGQIPIGDGTTDPVLANITGTANQVTVTNGAGTITLSAPQDIGTASSPTFVTGKFSGLTDLKIPKHVDDTTGLADTTITVTANNEVTNASQPSFQAVTSATLTNVTGDGTYYDVVFGTEIYDQNADFDSTSTFTAPVAGRYLFAFVLDTAEAAAGHNEWDCYVITSNRNYRHYTAFAAGANPFTSYSRNLAIIADMDAADTSNVRIGVNGGAKVIDITSTSSRFSGALLH